MLDENGSVVCILKLGAWLKLHVLVEAINSSIKYVHLVSLEEFDDLLHQSWQNVDLFSFIVEFIEYFDLFHGLFSDFDIFMLFQAYRI